MFDQNSYFFQKDLQSHAQNPCNFGIRSGLDFTSLEYNPSCGDRVTMAGTVRDDRLTYLCFDGAGCVISVAMASKMTHACVGMTLQEIADLDEKFIAQLLGISLGINRIKCGLLPIIALRQGILTLQNQR